MYHLIYRKKQESRSRPCRSSNLGMKEHKKKAWIATAILLFVLFIWALIAVHDSAVDAARAARANKTDSPATCPFSKVPSTQNEEPKKKSPCCHSKIKESGEETKPQEVKQSSKQVPNNFEKYANLNDEELEEFLKQFTPEQLAKCPHLKARKTNKKK